MEISLPKAKVQQDTGRRTKGYNMYLKHISKCWRNLKFAFFQGLFQDYEKVT